MQSNRIACRADAARATPHRPRAASLAAGLLVGAAFAAASVGARAADVGVSVSVSQPGVYGRVDIGRFPQPQLVLSQPVVVTAAPVRAAPPVYMWVPPGHRKHWSKHCARYDACGVPVYFVTDQWYQDRVYRGAPVHPGARLPAPVYAQQRVDDPRGWDRRDDARRGWQERDDDHGEGRRRGAAHRIERDRDGRGFDGDRGEGRGFQGGHGEGRGNGNGNGNGHGHGHGRGNGNAQ